jgi:DNA (cytosine-5)-methyltransferase 1
MGVVCPTLIQTSYGERPGQAPRSLDLHEALGTIVAGGGKHALVASFLAQYNNNPDGSVNAGHSVEQPMSPITTKGPHQALVTGHLLSLKGTDRRASGLDEPAPAITAGGWHVAEVRAFLLKYYGTGAFASDLQDPLHTSTAMARFGLVMVHSQLWQIVDIGMRMLTPRELFNAQGFPRTYQIQVPWGPKRKPLTKSDQIRLVGNSVCPPVAIAIAKANAPLMSRLRTPAEAAVA